MTAAERFAEWALALDPGDIPSSVKHSACRHLVDGFGNAIAAARSGAVRPVVETAMRSGPGTQATIIGHGASCSATSAALANGALVHALDFDDTHAEALVHATAAVLPAAFAVGEEVGATGAEVLTASIAGYEIVARLGAAVMHGFHASGFHATSVCGVFASALIASRLYRSSVAQVANALGIAGSLAAGSLEFLSTGSSTKQLHPGFSGMNGILAARLAGAGADGPATIFEGEHGLFRTYAGASVAPEIITDGLGSRWETERITIKPYPACQLSHASLDALRAIGHVDPRAVEEILFDVPPDSVPIVLEPAAHKRSPRTPYEGKFSLPYCAAALLADGSLGIDAFEPSRLLRQDVLELAARVGYRKRTFEGAPADAPGLVEVRLRDRRVLHGEVKRSRGTPDEPLSDDELLAKFASNGGDAVSAATILDLERRTDVGSIVRATRIA